MIFVAQCKFKIIDLVRKLSPKADMVLVRDCFKHLSNALINATLSNIFGLKACGS